VPYEYTARIEGSREVEIRARVSGILLERSYQEGRPVKKGQLLFVIDPAPYRAEVQAAEASLAETDARRSRAEREVARLEPLLAANATSRRQFDDAVAEAEQARAGVLSAQARLDKAKLDLAYTRVVAPIAGLSSRAFFSEGSLVEPGDNGLLTRISQVQPIWVRFSVPDLTLLALRREMAAKTVTAPEPGALEIELVLADGSIHPEHGKVNFSDSMIGAETGSVDLRAELPNARRAPGSGPVVPRGCSASGCRGRFSFAARCSRASTASSSSSGRMARPRCGPSRSAAGSARWVVESGPPSASRGGRRHGQVRPGAPVGRAPASDAG
jgi:membrane fusion protein (multidrug efflux system)